MTTPDHPGEPHDESVPPPSLLDRLSQLEPEDDDDLFDNDEYDDDHERPADGAGHDVTPEPQDADLTAPDDGAFGAAAGEPAPPSHETVALPTAEQAPEQPAPVGDAPDTTGPDEGVRRTDVLEPAAALAVPAVTADRRTGPRSGRRGRRISLPVVALLVMTVLMAAATAYLWLQVRDHDRTETARRAGLEASRDAARLLFSYDYRTLDKDFSTGRALTTGRFRTEYDKTTTKVVADVAKQYKAVVKANVVTAGVVRATPSEVVTVVYVNQVTTSTRVTGEKVDLSRVRMTLERRGGRWLVTSVNAL